MKVDEATRSCVFGGDGAKYPFHMLRLSQRKNVERAAGELARFQLLCCGYCVMAMNNFSLEISPSRP